MCMVVRSPNDCGYEIGCMIPLVVKETWYGNQQLSSPLHFAIPSPKTVYLYWCKTPGMHDHPTPQCKNTLQLFKSWRLIYLRTSLFCIDLTWLYTLRRLCTLTLQGSLHYSKASPLFCSFIRCSTVHYISLNSCSSRPAIISLLGSTAAFHFGPKTRVYIDLYWCKTPGMQDHPTLCILMLILKVRKAKQNPGHH